MKSLIREQCKIKMEPIAMIFTNDVPKNAIQLRKDVWSCAINAVVSVTQGKTLVFDKDTCGCVGAGTGFGFGNQYDQFPGGRECSHYFFSIGNENWEYGRGCMEQYSIHGEDDFAKGVGFIKSPDHAKQYIDNLPIKENEFNYVVLKPLKDVDESIEKPEAITFFINMDQLAALVTLANYERFDGEGTIIPCCSACQAIGIYTMKEICSDNPRGVVGMNDPTARVFVKNILKQDYLTYSIPYKLFKKMESNIPGSLLEKDTWKKLIS